MVTSLNYLLIRRYYKKKKKLQKNFKKQALEKIENELDNLEKKNFLFELQIY